MIGSWCPFTPSGRAMEFITARANLRDKPITGRGAEAQDEVNRKQEKTLKPDRVVLIELIKQFEGLKNEGDVLFTDY